MDQKVIGKIGKKKEGGITTTTRIKMKKGDTEVIARRGGGGHTPGKSTGKEGVVMSPNIREIGTVTEAENKTYL